MVVADTSWTNGSTGIARITTRIACLQKVTIKPCFTNMLVTREWKLENILYRNLYGKLKCDVQLLTMVSWWNIYFVKLLVFLYDVIRILILPREADNTDNNSKYWC